MWSAIAVLSTCKIIMMGKATDTAKLMWSKTNRWHRTMLIFIILEMDVLPGGKVGFTCKDPALSHRFKGDTITAKHLFGTIILLPLAVLLLVERLQNKTNGRSLALRWWKEYMYGLLLSLTVVQALKLGVGSPRPHFFDTCSPREAETCQGTEYVSQYTCTKAHWLTRSATSFPSGHTTLGLHAGLFLVYYLHKRAKNLNRNIVLAAQVVLTLMAVFCGVSRMWDHRHHWWDVMAGAIVGFPILVYTVVYLCKSFEGQDEKDFIPDISINTVPVETKEI